ncbi:MAG: N-acetylmuramoyl-L-alanine amidase [Sedimentisphaerales bacterium]|nr:N-acetylmuramoyl-L-alanine amidase [Sedimentisphaerales bacterium]
MNNQGRLKNAFIILIISMSAGALILMALEGKPLKPVAFSLSSSSEVNTALPKATVGTRNGIVPGKWHTIEITFSSSYADIVNTRTTGELDKFAHFVICDGTNDSVDGQILATTSWFDQKAAALNPTGNIIRICLITPEGCFKPTPWQYNRLESLVKCLTRHCNIPSNQIVTVK